MPNEVTVNGVELDIDATAFVKWERRAERLGMTVEEAIAEFLVEESPGS